MRAVAIRKVSWPRFALSWERKPSHPYRERPTGNTHGNLERMASVLRDRQVRGKATSLRQLHAVSGIDQPRALRLLRELQDAEMVKVETDLHDPLGSLVALTPDALRSFDEVLLRD